MTDVVRAVACGMKQKKTFVSVAVTRHRHNHTATNRTISDETREKKTLLWLSTKTVPNWIWSNTIGLKTPSDLKGLATMRHTRYYNSRLKSKKVQMCVRAFRNVVQSSQHRRQIYIFYSNTHRAHREFKTRWTTANGYCCRRMSSHSRFIPSKTLRKRKETGIEKSAYSYIYLHFFFSLPASSCERILWEP